MKGNPISTLPPCYSFHIGEVIQIWLARLMWSLRNISHKIFFWLAGALKIAADRFFFIDAGALKHFFLSIIKNGEAKLNGEFF